MAKKNAPKTPIKKIEDAVEAIRAKLANLSVKISSRSLRIMNASVALRDKAKELDIPTREVLADKLQAASVDLHKASEDHAALAKSIQRYSGDLQELAAEVMSSGKP